MHWDPRNEEAFRTGGPNARNHCQSEVGKLVRLATVAESPLGAVAAGAREIPERAGITPAPSADIGEPATVRGYATGSCSAQVPVPVLLLPSVWEQSAAMSQCRFRCEMGYQRTPTCDQPIRCSGTETPRHPDRQAK